MFPDLRTFMDRLRADADLRSEYQSLKLDLAERFADDKSAYTDAKGPFIRTVMAALERSAAEGWPE